MVTYTNNFKNILDKITNVLRSEFKVKVVKGLEVPGNTNCIRIVPQGSDLLEYNAHSETRQYNISIQYLFYEQERGERFIAYMTQQVSHLEALIHDNINMTLSDSTVAIDSRVGSLELDADIEDVDDYYVAAWDFSTIHTGNYN